jgi:lysophospholipase L1-like esterase
MGKLIMEAIKRRLLVLLLSIILLAGCLPQPDSVPGLTETSPDSVSGTLSFAPTSASPQVFTTVVTTTTPATPVTTETYAIISISPTVTTQIGSTTVTIIPAPVTTSINTPRPLTDMTANTFYKGEDGGLYGSGLNDPPPGHRDAALSEIAKIQPLDPQGNVSPSGKIVLISIGMSNTTQEFSVFKQLAGSDTQKSPDVFIVDGAQGGQTAAIWTAQDNPWQVLAQRLRDAGVSPAQVQVAWVKQADAQPKQPFPVEAQKLQAELGTIMRFLKQKYPNVRIVYLSSRIYGGYATTALNPEPYAFESAFSIRWLIRAQINGDPGLNYNPAAGPVMSPLLLWGPYLWADGLNPRSDGLIWERYDLSPDDGTHPSITGREKVARMLLDFFKTDELARTWFLKSG